MWQKSQNYPRKYDQSKGNLSQVTQILAQGHNSVPVECYVKHLQSKLA